MYILPSRSPKAWPASQPTFVHIDVRSNTVDSRFSFRVRTQGYRFESNAFVGVTGRAYIDTDGSFVQVTGSVRFDQESARAGHSHLLLSSCNRFQGSPSSAHSPLSITSTLQKRDITSSQNNTSKSAPDDTVISGSRNDTSEYAPDHSVISGT